ncbi:hypothetical protein LJB96_05715, partial [Methanobrevibacter sp. OttesenSCG-928-K11]|nr:hypothetical protein [Methanobrevibacter sp. OttesenSCG-928-K11]
MGLFDRNKTPEQEKLDKLLGSFSFSQEFKDILIKNNLTVNQGQFIKRKMKEEVKLNQLNIDEIDDRLQYYIENIYELAPVDKSNESIFSKDKIMGTLGNSELISEGVEFVGTATENIKNTELVSESLEFIESKKIDLEKINKIYSLTGRLKDSPEFIEKLENAGLFPGTNYSDIIKNKLQNEVSTNDVSVDEIEDLLNSIILEKSNSLTPEEKIKIEKDKETQLKINKKEYQLNKINELMGNDFTSISPKFKELLYSNGIDEDCARDIKENFKNKVFDDDIEIEEIENNLNNFLKEKSTYYRQLNEINELTGNDEPSDEFIEKLENAGLFPGTNYSDIIKNKLKSEVNEKNASPDKIKTLLDSIILDKVNNLTIEEKTKIQKDKEKFSKSKNKEETLHIINEIIGENSSSISPEFKEMLYSNGIDDKNVDDIREDFIKEALDENISTNNILNFLNEYLKDNSNYYMKLTSIYNITGKHNPSIKFIEKLENMGLFPGENYSDIITQKLKEKVKINNIPVDQFDFELNILINEKLANLTPEEKIKVQDIKDMKMQEIDKRAKLNKINELCGSDNDPSSKFIELIDYYGFNRSFSSEIRLKFKNKVFTENISPENIENILYSFLSETRDQYILISYI